MIKKLGEYKNRPIVSGNNRRHKSELTEKQLVELLGGNTGGDTPGGGDTTLAPIPPKAVNFRDYDGTILHAYSKDEFLALNELPPLPTQAGLICQEWNWSWEEAREYVNDFGFLDIGAIYTTDDGSTRLYVSIDAIGRKDIILDVSKRGYRYDLLVDWGDGTQEIYSDTSTPSVHSYANSGEYVIKISGNPEKRPLNICSPSRFYSRIIKKIEFGECATIVNLTKSVNRAYIPQLVIPNTITTIESSGQGDCEIGFLCLPKSITSITVRLDYSNGLVLPSTLKSIKSLTIEGGVRNLFVPKGCSIMTNAFAISSLVYISLPKEITNIPSYTFQSAYSLRVVNMSGHTVVPSVQTNSFQNAGNDFDDGFIVVVPDALYDEWIAATNWSSIANRIVKASEFNG